jgi:hypothetical protein
MWKSNTTNFIWRKNGEVGERIKMNEYEVYM